MSRRKERAIQGACDALFAACDYDFERAQKELEGRLRYQEKGSYRIEISTLDIRSPLEDKQKQIEEFLNGDPISASKQYDAAREFADFLKRLFDGWMCVINEPRNGRQIWTFEVPLDQGHPKEIFTSEYKVRISACVYMIG